MHGDVGAVRARAVRARADQLLADMTEALLWP